MKKLRTGLAVACISISMLTTSCRTDQSLSSFLGNEEETSYASNKPHFINDIAIGASNENDISISNAISMSIGQHNKINSEMDAMVMNAIDHDRDREAAKINPAEGNTLARKYASMLGVLPTMLSNFSLYKFIDEWYGVRYRLGGTDKSGIDCSAFVQRLYETVFHMDVVRTAFEQFKNASLTWNLSSLREGDLVFFKIHSKRITHVGIYLMNNFFVHASSSQGIMISNLNEDYWQHYFAGAGQIMKGNNG